MMRYLLPFIENLIKSNVKVFLQTDDKLYKSIDYTESGFVFAPFNNKEDSILIPLDASEVFQTKFINSNTRLSKVETHDVRNASEREAHIKLVQKGIVEITENKFDKVVLSRNETVTISNNNPMSIFKQLLDKYTNAFVYCWYHPKVGLWLGATPETLIKVEDKRFSTMALAGTQEYKGTLDVTWETKEKEEQQFVTDFIANSLSDDVENLNINEAQTVKAANLLHIKTQITGTLKGSQTSFKKLIDKLHPTPAVCGLPKIAAKQFILDNEAYNREFYTGFLGELNLKEKRVRNSNRRNVENNAYNSIKTVSNLFVNLRCMQLKRNEALIYVGGGITKDSNPEQEWQETVNKTKTIKGVL